MSKYLHIFGSKLDTLFGVIVHVVIFLTMYMNFNESVKSIKNNLLYVLVALFFFKLIGGKSLPKTRCTKKFIMLCVLFFISLVINFTVDIGSFYNVYMAFILFAYYALWRIKDIQFSELIRFENMFVLFFLIFYVYLFLTNTVFSSGQRTTVGLVLPLLFLSMNTNNKCFFYINLVVFIGASLLSMNRTYIILAVLSAVFLLKSKSIKFWIPIIAFFALSSFYIFNKINTELGINILEKNEDGDITSGRSEIYDKVFSMISNSNIFDLLFGHGFSAVSKTIKFSAHSDFLEITYDYGVIALFVYISFIVTLLKTSYHNKSISLALLCALLFSYGISNNLLFSTAMSLPVFMCIGLNLCFINLNKSEHA